LFPGAQLVHLDIKSANVLLQDATFAVAKLADLGVSRYLVQGDQSRQGWRGVGAQLFLSLVLSGLLAWVHIRCQQAQTWCVAVVWGRAWEGYSWQQM